MKCLKNTNAKLSQQSGQAMLEYLLVIFVIVSIFLGIMLEVSRGTSRFAQNYFGDYLQCLLETGELPRLGSDDVPETECDDAYMPFTITDGRPFANTNLSDNNLSPDSASGSTNNDANNNDDRDSSANNNTPKPGTAGVDGAATQFRNNLSGRPSRVPTGQMAKNTDSTDVTQGRNNFTINDDGSSESAGRTAYIPVGPTGLQPNTRGAQNSNNTQVIATENENPTARAQSKIVPIAERKERDIQSDADVNLSFADYLRYLVIAVIILAIIIVVGGQLLQFQKSRE